MTSAWKATSRDGPARREWALAILAMLLQLLQPRRAQTAAGTIVIIALIAGSFSGRSKLLPSELFGGSFHNEQLTAE